LATEAAEGLAVRQWLVKDLGAKYLTTGTPPIKQLYDNPVTAETTLAKYFAGAFNISAMYTTAVVVVDNQEIHIHKVMVAKACSVLATQWEPLGARLDHRMVLDVYCEPNGRNVSHAGALAFFEFLYTGQIRWPDGNPDSDSALELLVMAPVYHVLFRVCVCVCAAEMVQRPAVDLENHGGSC